METLHCAEVRVTALLTTRHVYQISTCPEGFDDTNMIRHCAKAVPDSQYSYVLDIPVINEQGNVYRC